MGPWKQQKVNSSVCFTKPITLHDDGNGGQTTNPLWVISIIVLVHLAWTALLIGSFVEKVRMAGLDDVLEHFTNWSLAFQIFFYSLTLILLISEDLFQKALLCFFFPLHGVVWIVFILINIVLNINPDVLEQYFKKFSIGFVLSANEFLHSVPIMVILMFAFYHRCSLTAVLRYYYQVVATDGEQRFWFVIYQSFAPLILLGLYDSVYNPNDVYEVSKSDFPPWAGWVVSIGVCLVVNTLPVMFIVTYYQRVLKKENML